MQRTLAMLTELPPEFIYLCALGAASFTTMLLLCGTVDLWNQRDIERFGPRHPDARS